VTDADRGEQLFKVSGWGTSLKSSYPDPAPLNEFQGRKQGLFCPDPEAILVDDSQRVGAVSAAGPSSSGQASRSARAPAGSLDRGAVHWECATL